MNPIIGGGRWQNENVPVLDGDAVGVAADLARPQRRRRQRPRRKEPRPGSEPRAAAAADEPRLLHRAGHHDNLSKCSGSSKR